MSSLDTPSRHDNQDPLPPHLPTSWSSGEHSIPLSELHDPERVQAVIDDLARISGQITVNLDALPTWSDEDRSAVLRFLVDSGLSWLYVVVGETRVDLLAAVLAVMPGTDDPRRHERVRRAAIEVVALVHPSEIHAACDLVRRRLQDLQVRGWRVERLIVEAETLVQATRRAEQDQEDSLTIDELFPSARAPEGLRLPPGWRLNDEGELTNTSGTTVPSMLITGRLVNRVTGSEWVMLAWRRGDDWRRETVPRGQIASAREIVALANIGLPVTSNNAAAVVAYLAVFESTNLPVLTCGRLVDHFGWVDEVCNEFLWGQEIIRADSTNSSSDEATAEAVPLTDLVFQGGDAGNYQLARGFRSVGTLDAWRDLIAEIAHLPVVMMVISAALAAPLLKILRVLNLIVSLVASTSSGKTTVLRLGAGVWGCPDENQESSLLQTWDTTSVAIPRVAAMFCDMALCLDETKRARSGEFVAKALYDLVSGRERGRGSVASKGLQQVATYQNVTITTGEESVTGYTQDGGSRARVLESWRLPFDATNAATAELVRCVRELTLANYGHAGPAFVRWVLAHRADWNEWRREYANIRAELESAAPNNPVAGRMSEAFALLVLTARLATDAGLLPRREGAAAADVLVWSLWADISAESREADRAVAALEFVWSWYKAHAHDFQLAPAAACRLGAPHDGWAGRWIAPGTGELTTDGAVAFHPYKLAELLKEQGYHPDAIYRAWHTKGWLAISTGRRYLRVRDGSTSVDMIAIKMTAIREVLGDDQPAQP